MAELTLGQRIAQERKKLGISQVGLATRLDVSRQAISKWESDAAIPEIDKLIALSKLYGVTVGWLLGVEELPGQPDPELSEAQWKTVETYIKRYQSPPKPHLTAFHYLFAIGVSVLVFLLMYGSTTRVEKLLQQSTADIAVLTQRVDALESHGSNSLAHNSKTLLASFSLTPSTPDTGDFPHMTRGETTIAFKAIPALWNSGDEGRLHVQTPQGEVREVPCQWDGAMLTASFVLAVEDGYEYAFVVKHPGNGEEAQLLTDETAQNLQSAFHISGVHQTGTMDDSQGKLLLKGYSSTLTMPAIYRQERLEEPGYYSDPYLAAWEKVEYVLMVGDSASGAAYYRLPVVNRSEGLQPEDPFASTLTVAEPELCFSQIALSNTTTHAQLWLYASLDNGLQERYLLNVFQYRNGSFLPLS